MPRNNYQETVRKIENMLSVLSNRLRTATYEEDKVEALEKIAAYSICSSVAVGALCLKDVFCSIPDLDSPVLPFAIIKNVLECHCNSELLEILLSDSECRGVFFGMRLEHKIEFLDMTRNSRAAYRLLSGDPRCVGLIVEIVEEGTAAVHAASLIAENSALKEMLMENQFLERIFSLVEKESQAKRPIVSNRKRSSLEHLLVLLLTDSYGCSRRFLEERMHLNAAMLRGSPEILAFSLFPAILLSLKEDLQAAQERLFIDQVIQRAVADKKYSLLVSLTERNTELSKTLISFYIDLPQLSRDAECDDSALVLFDFWASVFKPREVSVEGLRTALVAICHGYESQLSNEFVEGVCDDIVHRRNVSFDALLFLFVLSRPLKDDVARSVQPSSLLCCEEYVRAMAAVLLHANNSLSVDGGERKEVMKFLTDFRTRVCTRAVINALITEMLIHSVSDVIRTLLAAETENIDSSVPARNKYKDSPDHTIVTEVPVAVANEPKTSSRTSVLTDVLRSFRSEKNHETYDL